MNTQEITNYQRIAAAIEYIKANFKKQPDLNEVAEKANVSPYHFQRLFKDWAGVSPKKFLQYLSLEHAKTILREPQATLFDAAHETGLSGTSRLHDLFVNIEGMTPGEYKNGGEALTINFSFAETPFQEVIIASTPKGICHLAFFTDQTEAFRNLQTHFPQATFIQTIDIFQQNALAFFSQEWSKLAQVKLHLKGTGFQIKVWEALLKIPVGSLTTYARISAAIDNHKASRAVGSAIGSNPVAYLIPCHRVIKSTGETGQYHWGSTRKNAIIGWEAAAVYGEPELQSIIM